MRQGFTLIELLVVLALMGVLLALAVPGMQRWLARTQVEAVAQAFVGDMRWARAEALKRSGPVSVCASADGKSCQASGWAQGWLVFADDNGNGQLDAADVPLRVQAARDGVASMASRSPSNDRLQFVFLAHGSARAATQTLWVSAAGQSYARLVCVSSQGRTALRALGDAACEA